MCIGGRRLRTVYCIRTTFCARVCSNRSSRLPQLKSRDRILSRSVCSLLLRPYIDSSSQPLEATLYIVYSIHEAVPADEAIYLPYLFSASILGALPSTPPARSLRSTTLRIVGAYSLWFSNQPAACLEAVQFVVKGLEDAHLAPVAARALASLCSDSRRNLVPHIHSFVQVLGSLEGKVEVSFRYLHSVEFTLIDLLSGFGVGQSHRSSSQRCASSADTREN